MSIEIKTDNLVIRRGTEDEFERYWGMLNEQIMGLPKDKREKLSYTEHHEEYLRINTEPFTEDGAEFVVVGDKNKFVGRCGFRISELGAEFYYTYCMDSWGHGYSYEAGEAVLSYLFANFSHEKYFMRVDESDAAAVRVCDRLGFEKFKDGVFAITK